jgi:hypothetical protein
MGFGKLPQIGSYYKDPSVSSCLGYGTPAEEIFAFPEPAILHASEPNIRSGASRFEIEGRMPKTRHDRALDRYGQINTEARPIHVRSPHHWPSRRVPMEHAANFCLGIERATRRRLREQVQRFIAETNSAVGILLDPSLASDESNTETARAR